MDQDMCVAGCVAVPIPVGEEVLESPRCRFVQGARVLLKAHFSTTALPLWKEHLSLVAACVTCKQPDAACCLFLSVFGSCKCEVCAVTGFLFPLVSGTSRSQSDAEQTNGPPFPKVTSCFPTHLQRHFPSPGLAWSWSLSQKGGRGRCCSSQSS